MDHRETGAALDALVAGGKVRSGGGVELSSRMTGRCCSRG